MGGLSISYRESTSYKLYLHASRLYLIFCRYLYVKSSYASFFCETGFILFVFLS